MQVMSEEDKLAPSQQGISQRQTTTVLTGEPLLEDIQRSLVTQQSIATAGAVSYVLTGLLSTLLPAQSKEGADASKEALEFVRSGLKKYQEEEGTSGESVGTSETEVPMTAGLFDPVAEATRALQKIVSQGPSTISNESAAIRNGMSSQDNKQVEKTLLGMAGLDTLTESQRAFVKNRISKLAELIANNNKIGGSALMKFGISELIMLLMSRGIDLDTDASLSQDQKDTLLQVLKQISDSISAANLDFMTKTQQSSQEYSDLASGDPKRLKTLLANLLRTISLPTGTNKEALSAVASLLAEKLIHKKKTDDEKALSSPDEKEVSDELKAALEELVASGAISPEIKQAFMQYVLPVLGREIAAINSQSLKNDLKSSDAGTIEKSLRKLSGFDKTQETPVVQKVLVDYLKAMTMALAFMAQIRSLISRLESAFTSELSKAKLEGISSQVQASLEKYQKELETISKTYKDQVEGIEKAKLMKIFMPLIAVILAIVAVIVSAVSLFGAAFTGGASAVGGAFAVTAIAKLIAACVAFSVSVAACVLTIIDSGCQWGKGKSVAQLICDAAGISDPATVAAISWTINIAVILITAVATCGIGIPAALGNAGALISSALGKTIGETVRAILQEVIQNLLKRQLLKMIISALIGTFFSSGLVTQGLVAMIKAFQKVAGTQNEELANILGTILTIVVMLAAMFFGGKITGGSWKEYIGKILAQFKSFGRGIGNFFSKNIGGLKSFFKQCTEIGAKAAFEELFSRMKEALKRIFDGIADALKDLKPSETQKAVNIVQSTTEVAAEASSSVVEKTLLQLIQRLQKINVSPTILETMKVVATLLQITTSVIRAISAKQGQDNKTALAALERDAGAAEALSSFLSMMSKGPGLDLEETVRKINQGSKEMAETWEQFVNFVAGLIASASERVSDLTTRGAY
jgi:hypothetical protein